MPGGMTPRSGAAQHICAVFIGQERELVPDMVEAFAVAARQPRHVGAPHQTLRPEGTAPVVRAFVQHRPPTPWKVVKLESGFQ